MEKRAIIAIVLTFVIILFWGFIQSKFFPQPPSQTPTKEIRKEELLPPEKKVEKGVDSREVRALGDETKPSKKRMLIRKEVSVETQNYWAVFTSEDARLKHFKLKQYEDRVERILSDH